VYRRLLLIALLIALGSPSRADGLVESVLPCDDVEGELAPGGVDAYLIDVVVGTELRMDLRAEGPDDGFEGTAPTLVALSPASSEILSARGLRVDRRFTAAAAGVHRIEVRAGSYQGEYELEFDAKFPVQVTEAGVPPGESAIAALDVPLGANVRVDVKRISGAPPEVVAVRDATGRALPFAIKRGTNKRVRLKALPVTAPGGLFVEVRGRGGAAGTYRVTAKSEDDDDDAPDDNDDDDREERRIVVQLAPGADAQAIADALGYDLVRLRDGYAVLETPEGREGFEDEDARGAAEAEDDIVGAEADRLARIPEGSQSNPVVLGSDIGRVEFDGQPAFQTIRVEKARLHSSGAGIVVAILDTGIDASHAFFTDHTVLAGHDFVDDDADPSEEKNLVDDDLDGEIDEGYGHGTFIAGLVLGVAPEAQILPIRVLDSDGRGSVSNIAAGVYRAVESGADVINMSLGMRNRSHLLGAAVRFALASGVAVVASTGNRGDLTRVDFPGGIANVSAVTSVDGGSRRPSFANAGGRTGIAAPGVDLIGPYPGDEWGTWSGTSFSAALVSGTSALVRDRRPRLVPRQVGKRIRRRSQRLVGTPRAEKRLLGGRLLDAGKASR